MYRVIIIRQVGFHLSVLTDHAVAKEVYLAGELEIDNGTAEAVYLYDPANDLQDSWSRAEAERRRRH